MTPPAPESSRESELRAGIALVEERIEAACRRAGRARDEITLIVVTKTYPSEDVRLLAGLGVTQAGESRAGELAEKAEGLVGLGMRWHMVGQVQTNKARVVARYADVVHSVDRIRLADALGRAATTAERELDVLVQVNLDQPSPGAGAGTPRGGADPAEVAQLGDHVQATPGLNLAGVMAVAPHGGDPRPAFERLQQIATALRCDHPQATTISAGMSADLEAAVDHGATHLRVGSAILGSRPPLD